MQKLSNINLKTYTTIKIGGIANNFYIPESESELINLVTAIQERREEYYLVANGSNLLINDEKQFKNVIFLKKFNKEIIEKNDNFIYCGASVLIQQLINFINERGLGGIEYLYSVPGTVGGAVCMNAGRGKKYGQSISDYIEMVEVLVDNKKKLLDKKECMFSYRNSIFKNNNFIVLGVYFKFQRKDKTSLENARKERIEYSKREQDITYPNLGSVFSDSNVYLMKFMRIFSLGYSKGIKYSKKTNNWIINKGMGNYRQAMKLIKLTELIHKVFHQKIEREIIVWK